VLRGDFDCPVVDLAHLGRCSVITESPEVLAQAVEALLVGRALLPARWPTSAPVVMIGNTARCLDPRIALGGISLQIVAGISENVVSGSLVLAQVIDDRRGRGRLEVIVVVAQSAPSARLEAIDAEVHVVAGGGCWRGSRGSNVAGKTLRAAENPLDSTPCLQAFPLPVAPGQWAVTVTTRAGRRGDESCSRSCR